MADEGSENIGGVSVKVTADFTDLDAAFDAAVTKGVAEGKTLGEAIAAAMAAGVAPGTLATQKAQTDTAAASAAMRESIQSYLGPLQSVGTAAQASAEQHGNAFRQMTGDIRGYTRAIYILYAPEELGRMIQTMVDWLEKQRVALFTAGSAWQDFNNSLRVTDDELKVSNDRLAAQIAKVEGTRPPNNLKMAIDEITLSADKLSDALDKDLQKIVKMLEMSLTGRGPTGIIEGGADQISGLQEQVARAIPAARGPRGYPIQTGSDLTGLDSIPGIAALDKQSQIQRMKDELPPLEKELEDATRTYQSLVAQAHIAVINPDAIQAAGALVEHLGLQIQRVQDQIRNATLQGQKELDTAGPKEKPDKFRPFEKFGDTSGGMNVYQAQAAIVVRQSEDLAKALRSDVEWFAKFPEYIPTGVEWLDKLRVSMLAEANTAAAAGLQKPVITDDTVKNIKDGAEAFKPMAAALGQIPSPAAQAAEKVKALDDALRQLRVKGADPQMQRIAADLKAIHDAASGGGGIGGQAGTVTAAQQAQAQVHALEQLSPVIKEADMETRRLFSNVEGALARDLTHWQGWSQTILGVFRDFAQNALQILLHALLQPLETSVMSMLSSGLAGILGIGGSLGSFAPLLALPLLAEGTEYVPRTMPAILHEGEAVLTKEQNAARASGTSRTVYGPSFNFAGAHFHAGLTSNDVMNAVVKAGRRVGAKW